LSKDQAIGALIFIICILLSAGYLIAVLAPEFASSMIGGALTPEKIRFWAVAAVVLVAFLAVMLIGAWIGWTMATTPHPKPLEELETEKKEEKE